MVKSNTSMSKNFATGVIKFYENLNHNWRLPKDIDLIYPFGNDKVWDAFSTFYNKYFSDQNKRYLLFGINPGRFGAGITGVPFTDPRALEDICGISNDFNKRQELSSIFVYEFIEAFGGVDSFYKHFMISSVCPLGFTKGGININYYDAKDLQTAVEKYIIESIQDHIKIGGETSAAISIGQGKNYKYLKALNEKEGFFDRIIPLPHPRWVMQYKRKTKDVYVQKYVEVLNQLIT